MGAAYKLTVLGDARPGMVLAEALLDRQGQMLLPKDAVLTASMLASLARHGIAMLPIVGEAAPAQDCAEIQQRLDHIFRKNERDNEDDWATGILRRYVEDYRFEREVAP